MITYQNYTNSIYQTSITDFYNGVLKLGDGSSYGTGSILYDGRSILTAAHVFDGMNYDNLKIYLYDGINKFSLNAKVTIYENYDDVNINGDMAIVTFDDNFDNLYNRYQIYRDSDEINQDYIAVGYGDVGIGSTGYIDSSTIHKLKTKNSFDADFNTLMNESHTKLSWNPLINSILIADFDNGLASTDIIGELSGVQDLGNSIYEGFIASGDSGGPAFINNLISGIASYTTKIDLYNSSVGDIDEKLNSSFGEIAAYQRVSYYQEWIDKVIRNNLPDAPTSKDEVKLQVSESDTYSYFMVEFLPLRNTVEDIVSVDYKTIDGTAKSGSDYVETYGTLNIYQDESYAIIAVELLDDNIKESNEYFYLQISNPINGSFGDNVLTLTAVRTIIDDDLIA